MNQLILKNNSPVATLSNVTVKQHGKTILQDINLCIRSKEQWAIIGKSGSGKTTLAHVLTNTVFHTGTVNFQFDAGSKHQPVILLIEQQHRFKNLSNTNDFYYQQRFNASDAGNSITVAEALKGYGYKVNQGDNSNYWVGLLHLEPLLQKPLIQLSNGENKRLQLAEALVSDPAFLVMDNPFTGLDTAGRDLLHSIIDAITAGGIHVILITGGEELPNSITHIAVLEKGKLTHLSKKEDYIPIVAASKPNLFSPEQLSRAPLPAGGNFINAIKMSGVCIRYGDKIVLDHIDWEVKKGECWNIAGPNGAGKSTLLSLINADNPQAYANEIYLFDKRRGRGESIWDIKRLIGYVSPELHLFFEQYSSCFDVVASGLFDTIGLFRQINKTQSELVDYWFDLLGMSTYKSQPLFRLSLGEQRMVLLTRALVKNPPLLILDEPCQGLDGEQAANFKQLIDGLSRHFATTVLYVSHYEKDIPSCVTHYLRLDNGRRV